MVLPPVRSLLRVGLAPSTASVLALPLVQALQARCPSLRLHVQEGPSTSLAVLLHAGQLDLAVLFDSPWSHRWRGSPLLDEPLFVMGAATLAGLPRQARVGLAALGGLPLLLPGEPQGLRALVMAAFARADCRPVILAEVDGLGSLMAAVGGGVAATIQPGASAARLPAGALRLVQVDDAAAQRRNLLACAPEAGLSAAVRQARGVLREVARRLVEEGRWPGAVWRGGD